LTAKKGKIMCLINAFNYNETLTEAISVYKAFNFLKDPSNNKIKYFPYLYYAGGRMYQGELFDSLMLKDFKEYRNFPPICSGYRLCSGKQIKHIKGYHAFTKYHDAKLFVKNKSTVNTPLAIVKFIAPQGSIYTEGDMICEGKFINVIVLPKLVSPEIIYHYDN
jgi:hypothetical protein